LIKDNITVVIMKKKKNTSSRVGRGGRAIR